MAKEDINRGPNLYDSELERIVRVAHSGQQVEKVKVHPDSRAAVLRTVQKKLDEKQQKQQGGQQ